MTKSLSIAVLCGGHNTEHEISILSARNVVAALVQQNQYIVHCIYLSPKGEWFLLNDALAFIDTPPPALVKNQQAERLLLKPGHQNAALIVESNQCPMNIDCVFPVLHGANGEDGSMQGLLQILDLPYVGPDILGSAVCMDKVVSKELLRQAGVQTPDWLLVRDAEKEKHSYQQASKKLGDVLFVKPIATGSSVGVSKVKNEKEYAEALKRAFYYSNIVIVETSITGREIECSVLGNEKPVASLPGEIITTHEFYSYDAKYLDPNGAQVVTPANNLSDDLIQAIKDTAVKAFQALRCEGMARVDFLLSEQGDLFVNELNTIPGFTDISMYSKNWQASGLPYEKLLERLINLAMLRYQRQQALSQTRITVSKGEANNEFID